MKEASLIKAVENARHHPILKNLVNDCNSILCYKYGENLRGTILIFIGIRYVFNILICLRLLPHVLHCSYMSCIAMLVLLYVFCIAPKCRILLSNFLYSSSQPPCWLNLTKHFSFFTIQISTDMVNISFCFEFLGE